MGGRAHLEPLRRQLLDALLARTQADGPDGHGPQPPIDGKREQPFDEIADANGSRPCRARNVSPWRDLSALSTSEVSPPDTVMK